MYEKLILRIPLLASLPKEEISFLAKILRSREFPTNSIILHEGYTDDNFYILLNGQVEIIKSLGTTDERLLAVQGEGTLLGEMSLYSEEGHHTASVRTLTPVRLLEMSRKEFQSLLNRQPAIAYDLVRTLSKRLEESENITILELRDKNRELTIAYQELQAAQAQIIEKEKMERELEIARQIQKDILPQKIPSHRNFQFGALMRPAFAVGGDFYQFIELDQDRLGIVVGDVSDKSVPAALFMTLSYSLMRTQALLFKTPGEVLRAANNHLLAMNATRMFVTMIYGILDCASHNFSYARAGHLQPLIINSSGQKLDLPKELGQPLGLFDDPYLDEQEIVLSPGSLVLIYSDGLTDTMDAQGKSFDLDHIQTILASNIQSSPMVLCDLLFNEANSFAGELPQLDDFTVLTIKCKS